MAMTMARPVLAWLCCRMNELRHSWLNVELAKQLLRYGFIGLASNSAGYLFYLLLTGIGVAPKAAMTGLYGFGASLGFFGNKGLTFAYKGRVLGSGLRYCIAHALGYLLNLALLLVFVDGMGWSHQFVQAAAVLVVATYLFLAFKLFVFRERHAVSVGREL